MIEPSKLDRITINAPAKVNWFLELLGKRPDGFHQIETVMSTVSLHDTLMFSPRDDDQIQLRTTGHGIGAAELSKIPLGQDNLVYRAVEVVRESIGRYLAPTGVDVLLRKRIPSAAGLGGASSDAAATLMAMNRLWQAQLPMARLMELAAELGSDVPFFLSGGTAMCEGRGEIITPVGCPTGWWMVIAKPPGGLSTARVFGQLVVADEKKQVKAADVVAAVKGGDVRHLGRRLHNRLQPVASRMNEEINQLEIEFEGLARRQQCCGHQMSGSGSSYVGVFASKRMARRGMRRLQGRLPSTRFYCCRTIAAGNYDMRPPAR